MTAPTIGADSITAVAIRPDTACVSADAQYPGWLPSGSAERLRLSPVSTM